MKVSLTFNRWLHPTGALPSSQPLLGLQPDQEHTQMREMFSHPASVAGLGEPQDEAAELLLAPGAVTCSIPSGVTAGIMRD